MAQVKHFSPVALAYAKSLIELAAENGSDASVGAELNGIAQVVTENPTFKLYLADPSVSEDTRERTLKTIFGGRVSTVVLNTLLVLNSKGRIGHLLEVTQAYQELLKEKQGRIEVDVTVATDLGQAGLEEVRQLVNKALSKDSVIHQHIDDSIIGGLILKVGDRQIDGSVQTQIKNLREKLLLTKAL